MLTPTRTRAIRHLGSLFLMGTTLGLECGTGSEDPKWALELTMAGAGQGTLSADPPSDDIDGSSHYYPHGSTVTVTATPTSGSVFTGWGKDRGANAPGAGCTVATNPCTATMTERKSVIGNFVPGTGVRRFDGDYTGTTTKSGNAGTGPLELRVSNGIVDAWITPMSGTANTFTGTVDDAGVFKATLAAVSGGCPVTFTGQLTTSEVAGITNAVASGSFTLQGQNCDVPNGTWTVTRDRAPVTRTVRPEQSLRAR